MFTKHKFLLITTMIFAQAISANPDPMFEIFQIVVKSKAMDQAVEQARSQGYQITSVTHTETQRCMSCFSYEVMFKKYDQENWQNMTVKLGTSLHPDSGRVIVKKLK